MKRTNFHSGLNGEGSRLELRPTQKQTVWAMLIVYLAIVAPSILHSILKLRTEMTWGPLAQLSIVVSPAILLVSYFEKLLEMTKPYISFNGDHITIPGRTPFSGQQRINFSSISGLEVRGSGANRYFVIESDLGVRYIPFSKFRSASEALQCQAEVLNGIHRTDLFGQRANWILEKAINAREIFSTRPIITLALIVVSITAYWLSGASNLRFGEEIVTIGANSSYLVLSGQVNRLVSG
ncbi:MAG: hypothetical protein KDD53_07845, partial [Bdellovibrionales bacterium]|nr:hypothetical protein [Bdellovibrionales bacterium]